MKIQFSPREQGNVLITAVIISAVLGLTLASYMNLVSDNFSSVMRSQMWNSALPATEAGIEEGLTQAQLAATNLTANGWSSVASPKVGSLSLAGTTYTKSRTLADGSSYVVAITPSGAPVITAAGTVVSPLGSGTLTRTVQVKTSSKGMFLAGLTAKGAVSLSGGASMDSFNSTNPLYSTGGHYDVTKRRDNGKIATDDKLLSAITESGGVTIYGSVDTGPGGTDTFSGNAVVGSLARIAGGGAGIQAGHELNDMNVSFPDVSAPFSGGYFTPGSGTVNGTSYTIAITAPGNYELSSISLSGQQQMIVAASNVVLYVTGAVSLSGQSSITVSSNSSLAMYVGGQASLTGQGVANATGTATNFMLYGLPTSTSVSLSGNAGFIGVIYAPEAAFSLTGGGSKSIDLSGAAVVSTATITGNMAFHYDESLGNFGGGAFTIVSWNEF
jgi:hypothetical protein